MAGALVEPTIITKSAGQKNVRLVLSREQSRCDEVEAGLCWASFPSHLANIFLTRPMAAVDPFPSDVVLERETAGV